MSTPGKVLSKLQKVESEAQLPDHMTTAVDLNQSEIRYLIRLLKKRS